MARTSTRSRSEGTIRARGDSWQVSLFTGYDPRTGRRLYLTGTARTEAEARRTLNRFRSQRDEQRAPATRAEFSVALSEWLAIQELEVTTRASHDSNIRNHIGPALGAVPVAKITPRMLESFYAELRRCRAGCHGEPRLDHRVVGPHECEAIVHRRPPGRPPAAGWPPHDCVEAGCVIKSCPPHECTPLANATINKIHFVISGALSAAVRWGWIATNPATVAKKPRQPTPQPNPPTPEQAGRIVAAAWEVGPDWGTLVWLTMVTGVRRAELLALRWSDVDLAAGYLTVRRNLVVVKGNPIEKDTKTHQMRRIALDPATVEVLVEHRARWDEAAAFLGIEANKEAYLFSHDPGQARPYDPSAVTHKYARMCASIGIDSHLHALRHYSATELLGAGVDLRTVAGRLGHGGGGTTTLRVYAAFVGESDRRAAEILGARMVRPQR